MDNGSDDQEAVVPRGGDPSPRSPDVSPWEGLRHLLGPRCFPSVPTSSAASCPGPAAAHVPEPGDCSAKDTCYTHTCATQQMGTPDTAWRCLRPTSSTGTRMRLPRQVGGTTMFVLLSSLKEADFRGGRWQDGPARPAHG